MARDAKVIIKVEKDVKYVLETQAKGYGLALSTLGAYILGNWAKEITEKTGGALPAVDHEPGVPG